MFYITARLLLCQHQKFSSVNRWIKPIDIYWYNQYLSSGLSHWFICLFLLESCGIADNLLLWPAKMPITCFNQLCNVYIYLWLFTSINIRNAQSSLLLILFLSPLTFRKVIYILAVIIIYYSYYLSNSVR